jgi:DNA topoisomerase-1
VLDALNDALGPHIFPDKGDGSDPRTCPTCGTGQLSLKTGKFGAFIGCSNYPECRYTRQLGVSEGDGEAESADKELGLNPATGLAVWLKNGRFGPYVEEPPAAESGDKPKRSSCPRAGSPADLDLEKALRLLSLPARSAAPGRRQEDHRGPGTVRTLRAARRHLRQSGERRGGVRHRPEPRRRHAG